MNERKCCMAMPSWFIGSLLNDRRNSRMETGERFLASLEMTRISSVISNKVRNLIPLVDDYTFSQSR